MSIPNPDAPNIDIGPSMLGICWTLYSVAGVVVAVRVYTQLRVSRNFGIGDILMIFASIFGFTHIGLLTVSHHYGMGRHFFYLSDELRVKAMEWEFIAEPFGPLTAMCGRVAFIILMFRLFGVTTFRRVCLYFLAAQNIVINLFTCITIYAQCEKVQSLWDPVGYPPKCWPAAVQVDIGFFQGATSSLTDLLLTILPLSVFYNLQMELRLKLGLAALLGLSVFAFASSIVKTIELKSIGEKEDYSYGTVNFMNWVVIENTCVMVGASIPLLRPLFRSKKQAMSASMYCANGGFEMSGGNSSSANGRKGPFSTTQSKSIVLQSSSEENILPQDAISGVKLVTHVGTNDDCENENYAEMGIKGFRSDTLRITESPNEGGASRSESRISVKEDSFRSKIEALAFWK